jgi:hypothetical protein
MRIFTREQPRAATFEAEVLFLKLHPSRKYPAGRLLHRKPVLRLGLVLLRHLGRGTKFNLCYVQRFIRGTKILRKPFVQAAIWKREATNFA